LTFDFKIRFLPTIQNYFERCSVCYGRDDHVQAPDPVSHERGKLVALMDHSYHQVANTPTVKMYSIAISEHFGLRFYPQKMMFLWTFK